MDFSLRSYKVKLSLVYLLDQFEPPIAKQKVTKFLDLLTYLPTTCLLRGSCLLVAIKSDT